MERTFAVLRSESNPDRVWPASARDQPDQDITVFLLPSMAEPKEISAYIASLATESNSYIKGQTLTVSGGE